MRLSAAAMEEGPLKRPERQVGAYVIGGIVAVLAHVLIPGLLLFSSWLLEVLGLAIPADERERPPLPDQVIAAEFVQLGKERDPDRLPQRKVPPKVKRRPDTVAVSKDMDPEPKPKREDEDNPPEAEEDLLDNLVDRAKAFAEDVEYEQTGSPDGIQGGSAEASEGNIYLGQLKVFFRRGWEIPNVVSNPDKLQAVADVDVADDGTLRQVGIARSSGNALFDQSVVDRVEALIDSRAKLPEPPSDEIRDQYFGRVLPIAFSGKGMR